MPVEILPVPQRNTAHLMAVPFQYPEVIFEEEMPVLLKTILKKIGLFNDVKYKVTPIFDSGLNTIISICETESPELSFSIATSRYPIDDREKKDHLRNDFNNLLFLYEAFLFNLNESSRKKFNVVRPMHFGNFSRKERTYNFFTMNQVTNQYTLGIKQNAGFPYLCYLEGFTKRTIPRLEVDESYEKYKEKAGQLIEFLSLVYLLSGNRVPKGFSINQGDIMADLSDEKNIKFTLTTVQGGFSQYMTDGQFISWIKGITEYEQAYGSNKSQPIQPFYDFDDREIIEILNKTRQIIINR